MQLHFLAIIAIKFTIIKSLLESIKESRLYLFFNADLFAI